MIHKCILEKNNDSVEMAPHGKICFVALDCFQAQVVCNFV